MSHTKSPDTSKPDSKKQGVSTPLSDTFLKNSTNYSGASAGKIQSDGGGMYLQVTKTGKYWRMNYRFADKQKTLTLGAYPEVSLAKARQGREKAQELLYRRRW